MDDGSTTGELIASLVYLVAGARLLRLSSLTNERPERLLGSALLYMGLGSLLYSIAILLPLEQAWTPFNFAGRISYVIGFILVAVFTRRVFRAEQRWAAWLVYLTVAAFAAGVGGSAMSGDWEGFTVSSGWYWLELVGYMTPVTWTCAEASAEHLRARRRVQLGLCDPLVCNRMLLWAGFAALQVLANVISVGQYAAFEREGVFTAGWDRLYAVVSIGSLIPMWTAFFPPGFYRRWVKRSHAEAS